MRKVDNKCHVEGYLYEHKLENKVTGETSKNPGTEFITGTIGIATDDELTNVVQVHFTYVTAVTSKGKANATFNILQAIIDGKIGSVMEHGKENASMLRIDTAIGLNEWYDTKGNGSLVSVKRNEGGFVHQTQELGIPKNRATFDVDMLINSAVREEPDEENGKPERMILKGYIFDFRKSLLPVDFVVYDPKGMDYFENLDISQSSPVFTEVRGTQISQTIVKMIEEEGAFGDASVREVRSSQREFVVSWVKPIPYDWDGDDLLATELDEMVAARELYLADVKRRQDEYEATKGNGFSTGVKKPAATSVKKKDYDF